MLLEVIGRHGDGVGQNFELWAPTDDGQKIGGTDGLRQRVLQNGGNLNFP